MVVFNPLILQNWKLSGYKFIYVLPRNKYGVLRPLSEDRSVKRGYTIEIGELPLLQISDNYFFTKEKDALHRSTVSRF